MQDIYYSGWAFIVIITVVLAIAHIGLHKKETKFNFPLAAMPLYGLTTLFFWLALQMFNFDKDWKLILIPFIAGLIISVLIQTFTPKGETSMALMSFFPFLIIYHYFQDNLIFILGLFTAGMLIGINLRLLRAEKFLGNMLASAAIVLPIYAGLSWLTTLGISGKDLNERFLLLISVTLLAGLYSFALNLFGEDKYGNKRQLALVVTVLVIWLLNNYLNLEPPIIYLLAGSFVLAQILEVLHVKLSDDPKSYSLEAFTGLGLILITGFIVTRLFGIWGLILVSVCCLATSATHAEKTLNWPAIASMFFSVKVLIHIFINQTTLNVTGLNFTHPYVYVGLTIGLFIPFVILAFTVAYKEKFWASNFLILLVFGLVTPVMSNYLIHAEASGALILGFSVSALIVTIGGKILGTVFDHKDTRLMANSMLPLAGLTGLMLLLSQNLIEAGNIASRIARAETFAVVVALIILLAIAQLDITGHTEEEFYPEKS
jgi:hypothetical protein